MNDASTRSERAREALAAHPRLALGHFPTPLDALPRLGERIGLGDALWAKRDDCSGLGLGGNKVRKLEFLLGAARAEGAAGVLTTGALQSNHARQTAAAAARLGMRCELVLPRLVARSDPAYEHSGNRLLDELFGADLFVTEDAQEAAGTIGARMAAAKERGDVLYPIPPGGSSPVGCLGFTAAAVELFEQTRAQDRPVSELVVAVSTGGTFAGLPAGLALLGWPVQVHGVCVYQDAASTGADVDRLVGELADLLGFDRSALPPFALHDETLGAGYGVPSEAGQAAIRLCAEREGLLLDPVYTGKAMAWLAQRSAAEGHGATVFWHTGGTPALFAYADAFRDGVDR